MKKNGDEYSIWSCSISIFPPFRFHEIKVTLGNEALPMCREIVKDRNANTTS